MQHMWMIFIMKFAHSFIIIIIIILFFIIFIYLFYFLFLLFFLTFYLFFFIFCFGGPTFFILCFSRILQTAGHAPPYAAHFGSWFWAYNVANYDGLKMSLYTANSITSLP
jgi:hypothetical protein